ncbi:MAG: family 16 glycosylhydrolase [Chitinophagaceae bacterium]
MVFQPAPSDTLNPNKKVITTYFFKQTLSFKNGGLKLRYHLNKKASKKSSLTKEGWTISFEDNFDSLNTKKWRLGQPWGEYHPGNPHQYYSKEMISADSGFLHLRGTYRPKRFASGDSSIVIPYAVGLINSDISFQQKYGYFEIRSKNPGGAATWPAFWLTGAHKWPPEIDIFEMYGKKTGKTIHNQYATIHYGQTDTRSRGYLSKKINLPNNTDTVFHVYACEWTPEYIKFITDGKAVAFIRMNARLRAWMDDEMVVIINNSFDAAYLPKNDLEGSAISNDFVVDWVRVWTRNSSTDDPQNIDKKGKEK